MKTREPFTLKKTLIAYNFLQSAANVYIAYEIFVSLSEHWEDRCNTKNSPKLQLMLRKAMKTIWKIYLLKLADLLDTVFFVLRKKQNQITFLHVFHHSGLCLMGSWGLRHLEFCSEKKSALRSIERGGQDIGPPRPIHRVGHMSFKFLHNLVEKCAGAPSWTITYLYEWEAGHPVIINWEALV
ncbi:elongation of very long chain fatty acids protein 7 [Trichonephila clavipes]|nr:elongation of very long chain fatty acids protein 7 [Trichonephila clavipes]